MENKTGPVPKYQHDVPRCEHGCLAGMTGMSNVSAIATTATANSPEMTPSGGVSSLFVSVLVQKLLSQSRANGIGRKTRRYEFILGYDYATKNDLQRHA